MSDERWRRLTALFDAAVTLPPEARATFLAGACADDPALHAEVERLVTAHERAGRFIEAPVMLHPGAWSAGDEMEEPPTADRRCGPYRIEREIGRGGMGAVYLAVRADGQYEKRVAVKLIKRGMDTELVLHRFRTERQILASLDHQNIARLLDGGTTADGRPYFVMEFIEGEPLDGYADTRRLSVPDRLRLFLSVCDAVAYAHRQHVIHRDIKPVNILVTAAGAPMLLDFGIARVLDPGGDEPTSSVTGVRLLTPEYASPEQVEGRRATAASDVYSLGVVLYELLTGRSPYRLRSRDPVRVAEEVRTTDPERPSTAVTHARAADSAPRRPGLEADRAAATGAGTTGTLRRRLRGDLDTIVLKALRKEPARRYQSVDALADDIRRHLEGRPVRARPDSFGYRAGKYVRRNRVAVGAALAAGAAALLLVAGFVAVRGGAGTPTVPSLAATGVLQPRDRILVADFANRTGDPALAAALSEALQVDLSQSPMVQVLSPRQVRSALVRMERSPSLALDDSLAREVALRDGVKAFVTGSIARVAGRYTITAELVSAQTGDLLTALRETAADSSDVIPAMDRLSRGLRERMGESLGSVRATPPLEQVTTASLAALRDYSEGVRTINAGDRERGIKLLAAAITLDTGFASAYRVLGVTYGDMVENGRMAAALEHAIANQARLPFYERYHTIASYAYNIAGNYEQAIAAYHRILARYPNDVRALNNLAYVHESRREYAVEESLMTRAEAADSSIPVVYMGTFGPRLLRGDFDGARRVLDRTEARFPGFHNAELAEIYLTAARQDWGEAERRARARLVRSSADDSIDGLETLAGIVMTRGRLAEAERYSRQVLGLSARLGSPTRYYSSALRIAYLDLGYRHDPAAALGVVDTALARFPLDSIQEGDRPYDALARFFAAAGRPARAREIVTRAERTHLGRIRGLTPERRWSLGVIDMADGRLPEAAAELRQAAATIVCSICALPDLARAYDTAGNADSAIVAYERYLGTSWKWRFEPDAVELGWATKRLGELYEQRGDTAKAGDAYARLIQLWRGADPALQPVVSDARRRLAATGEAHRSPPPQGSREPMPGADISVEPAGGLNIESLSTFRSAFVNSHCGTSFVPPDHARHGPPALHDYLHPHLVALHPFGHEWRVLAVAPGEGEHAFELALRQAPPPFVWSASASTTWNARTGWGIPRPGDARRRCGGRSNASDRVAGFSHESHWCRATAAPTVRVAVFLRSQGTCDAEYRDHPVAARCGRRARGGAPQQPPHPRRLHRRARLKRLCSAGCRGVSEPAGGGVHRAAVHPRPLPHQETAGDVAPLRRPLDPDHPRARARWQGAASRGGLPARRRAARPAAPGARRLGGEAQGLDGGRARVRDGGAGVPEHGCGARRALLGGRRAVQRDP
ncbi:MAG TPA: protein kinase [Gemmatimonadaceae bacterium]|nr:protein kinase [Gemmatimonadaceae bacterium]